MVPSDQLSKRPRIVSPPRVKTWYQTWQERFPEEHRERSFPGVRRRADVYVDQLVLELQHSRIGKAEIEARTRDYRSCVKTVAWLLDGTTGVELVAQRDGGHLLAFSSEHQTVATFRWAGFVVLVDAGDDRVYLVPLAQLRGGCAWVPPPRSVNEVVAIIRDPARHEELMRFEAPLPVCRLQAFQDPPGSGKTYRLIRNCVLALGPEGEAYRHYRHVFVLTKPHSAKNVVHQELVQQLREAVAAEHVEVLDESNDGRVFHYQIRRRGATDPVDIFFATVDSFIYHLAPRTHPRQSTELFKNLTLAIEAAGPNLDHNCTGMFRGHRITFNARSLICWDEATKLERYYLQALTRIMVTCAADAVLTGDVMQSIENSANSLRVATSSDEAEIRELLPHCNVEVRRGDEVRRFGSGLVRVLNATVQFTKYGAPVPRAATDVKRESEGECTIHGTPVLTRGCSTDLYAKTVDILWAEFERDVADLKLLPHELLIVAPLVKKNPVADEFRTRLHEFWTAHLDRPEVRATAKETAAGREFYEIYDSPEKRPRWLAYLHRSEEGRPVDTTLSEWASRGVSIHSSQGDGRRLVYVVGLSESALKCFSRGRTDVLEYESLWTVLMSRAKHRLRIFVERKYDDAWRRLKPFMSEATEMQVAPTFDLGTRPSLRRIDLGNDYASEDIVAFQGLQENAVMTVEETQRGQASDGSGGDAASGPRIVEDLHHDVRMAIYHFAFLARMLRDERAFSCKRQICAVLNGVVELESRRYTSAREYHEALRGVKNKDGFSELQFIPILEDSRMPEACQDFERYVAKAKEAMNLLLRDQEDLVDLDARGCLVFHHLIDISTNFQYAHTKIDMIYDVLDSPRSSHDEHLRAHYANVLKVARRAADKIVSDERLSGGTREWKLSHMLQLRTGEGECVISPWMKTMFLGFTDNAAVVVLLTPRLDATNITRVAGQALIVALLLESPGDKDVERVQACASHWLCVAPLEGGSVAWIDAQDLLSKNRKAAVAWLVGFLSDACKQTHPGIVEFYRWHLKMGALPVTILEEARKFAEGRPALRSAFSKSYVCYSFERMEEEEGGDFGEEAFKRILESKMHRQTDSIKKWLTGRGGVVTVQGNQASRTCGAPEGAELAQGGEDRVRSAEGGEADVDMVASEIATTDPPPRPPCAPLHGTVTKTRLNKDAELVQGGVADHFRTAAASTTHAVDNEAEMVAAMIATADPLPIAPGEWQNEFASRLSDLTERI